MPSNGFKEAELIELHDSGVCLSPENRSVGTGWQEFLDYESKEFSIDGETIAHLAQIFGISPQPIEIESPKGTRLIGPENLEFKISRLRQHVGEGDNNFFGCPDKIKNLWAKTEGPHLIQIRVDFFYEDDGKVENYSKELTYSGNYSVWWK